MFIPVEVLGKLCQLMCALLEQAQAFNHVHSSGINMVSFILTLQEDLVLNYCNGLALSN
jgi:hypothetical protein